MGITIKQLEKLGKIDVFVETSSCYTATPRKQTKEYIEGRLYCILQGGPLNWGETVQGYLSRLLLYSFIFEFVIVVYKQPIRLDHFTFSGKVGHRYCETKCAKLDSL